MNSRKQFHLISFVALVVCSAGIAFAAGENAIPYTEDFEAYSVGHAITNETGWTVVREIDLAVVTNMAHGITSPWFPSETDTRVLNIAGTAESLITRDDSLTTIYMDIMIKPQVRDSIPTIEEPLPMFAAYVNTDENLVFLHSYYDPASQQDGGYEKTWETITGVSIPTDSWTRVTFTIEFKGKPDWYDGYFQIQINDGTAHSYSNGYAGTTGNFTPDGGPWHMTANLPLYARGWIEKFVAKGQFQVDDLAISDIIGVATNPPSTRTTNGTPHVWLNTYYGGSDYETLDWSDNDGDGFFAWQEYWSGTDPDNSNSYLHVMSLATDGTVKWYGGTNMDNPMFSVWRSTNMADSGAWSRFTNVARNSSSMTNIWTDADGSNYSRMFYRVSAPTNTP